MKYLSTLITCSILISVECVVGCQSVKPKTIGLSKEKPEVSFTLSNPPAIGDRIVISAKLINWKTSNVVFIRRYGERNFIVKATLNGEPCGETDYGVQIRTDAVDYSTSMVTLKPNESYEFDLEISKLFNMSKKGKYLISVEFSSNYLVTPSSTRLASTIEVEQ